jgi:hypothetical protein
MIWMQGTAELITEMKAILYISWTEHNELLNSSVKWQVYVIMLTSWTEHEELRNSSLKWQLSVFSYGPKTGKCWAYIPVKRWQLFLFDVLNIFLKKCLVFYWRTHQRGEEEGGLRLDQACLHGLNPLLIRPLLKLHCFLIWRECGASQKASVGKNVQRLISTF